MSLKIELPPKLERQLREEAAREGQDAAELARAMLETQLAQARQARNQGAMEMMEQWLAEPPNEEDDRWSEVKAALEEGRRGQRKLFSA